jgi:YVTN family beta-propeller protein
MKCTTEQGLMARMKIHKSFTATCNLSDNGMSHKCLHWSIAQHIAMVLLVLGLGTSTTLAQIRAYVATNTVVATIPVGPIPFAPIGIAITPDGTRVYVTNAGDPFDVASGTVAVIDTATNTVVATIPDLGAFGVAITPDGARAYVANGIVSVIDTATNTVVATTDYRVLASIAVAITPDGTRAYATNAGNGFNNIPKGASVIDTATNTVVTNIPITAPGPPIAIAITPAPQAPKSKEECKQGGYLKFGPPAGPFKNQGQCVSYVEHHSTTSTRDLAHD